VPVNKVPGGFQWGQHGKVYPNQAGAQKQQAAALANGFQENQGKKQQAQKSAIQNLMQKHGSATSSKKKKSDAAEEAGEPKLSPKANALEEANEASNGK
jgi:hypothetical protein